MPGGRSKKRKPNGKSVVNLKKRHSPTCTRDTESTYEEIATTSPKLPAATASEIPAATTSEIPVARTSEFPATRSGLVYSRFVDKSTQTPIKILCDASTEIEQHSSLLPSCRRNKKDTMKESCMQASNRLSRATPPGFHWTSAMLVVMLRFVYSAVWRFNWTWTAAVGTAAELFEMKKDNIFKVVKQFRDDTAKPTIRLELETQIRGRGSAAFKAGPNAERFMILKPHHLKTITDYVVERTLTQRGMYNVHIIQ